MTSPFKLPTSCDTAEWRENNWDSRRGSNVVWPEGFSQPRTCSYCGSAHPDDIVALAKAGWECEASTKTYWHPPGSRAHHRAVIESFGPPGSGMPKEFPTPKHLEPTP